ncbi:MAG: helix-turn-helix transcriptional regulator [Cypionkella sp.]|nr:helix-turn-helix transcriptional regulator [Cypionkella sp.]
MDKIDATIGKSIRHYRWLQGISQLELATTIGITEAQLRSHEAGKSRVSAARLMAIAGQLGVEVSAFFQRKTEMAPPLAASETARPSAASDAVQNGKYLAALMTHFQRLSDTQKQAVLHLVMSISKEGGGAVATAA